MKTQRTRKIRQIVARNYTAMISCCGDDFTHICPECVVRNHMMHYALKKLAELFKKRPSSTDFTWLGTQRYQDGSVCMKLKSGNKRETVKIFIAGETMEKAKDWVSGGGSKSAKKENQP